MKLVKFKATIGRGKKIHGVRSNLFTLCGLPAPNAFFEGQTDKEIDCLNCLNQIPESEFPLNDEELAGDDRRFVVVWLKNDTTITLGYYEGLEGEHPNRKFNAQKIVDKICDNPEYWAGFKFGIEDVKVIKVVLCERAFAMRKETKYSVEEHRPDLCENCGNPDCTGEC
jgi:hypothetical protein